LTVSETDDKGRTAPIELPTPVASPPTEPGHVDASPEELQTPYPAKVVGDHVPAQARPATPQEREVLFIPLAVNIGDGFKFGCGFFLALVLAMLVGFVLLAALFALNGIFGLNPPIAP